MAQDQPIERNPDMDALHWSVIKLGEHIHRLGVLIRTDNRQRMEDAWLAAEGRFTQTIAALDDLIPGGCPDAAEEAALAAAIAADEEESS
jgi:hypothetical protein